MANLQWQTISNIPKRKGVGWGVGSCQGTESNRIRLGYDSLLKTPEREIKIAILNMLKVLVENVGNVHEF